jgi:CheY-like chemotaxis protein
VPQPLLQEVATMLRRTLGEAIEVRIDWAASVPDVLADSSGLETALINLALNARDAMPRGGRLEMAAHVVALEGNNFWKLPEAPYVVISVTDTGSGMPPEVMARAPEPFFTTKAPGKGSGLGLSMVYGFALQSGGAIDMASQPGFGTRVEIMLPVATPSGTTPPLERKAAPRREVRGSATILVVEDESDVRAVAARFLTAIGYRVIAADGPQEALQRLRSDTAIDLLFSDVVLGSATDGVELAREARQIRPDLPVLLTSGYPGAGRRRRVDSQTPEFAMLRKPYRREQLVSALEDLLGNA